MAEPGVRLYELEMVVSASSDIGFVYGGLVPAWLAVGRATVAIFGQHIDGSLIAPYPAFGRAASVLSGDVAGEIEASYPVRGRIKELGE